MPCGDCGDGMNDCGDCGDRMNDWQASVGVNCDEHSWLGSIAGPASVSLGGAVLETQGCVFSLKLETSCYQ